MSDLNTLGGFTSELKRKLKESNEKDLMDYLAQVLKVYDSLSERPKRGFWTSHQALSAELAKKKTSRVINRRKVFTVLECELNKTLLHSDDVKRPRMMRFSIIAAATRLGLVDAERVDKIITPYERSLSSRHTLVMNHYVRSLKQQHTLEQVKEILFQIWPKNPLRGGGVDAHFEIYAAYHIRPANSLHNIIESFILYGGSRIQDAIDRSWALIGLVKPQKLDPSKVLMNYMMAKPEARAAAQARLPVSVQAANPFADQARLPVPVQAVNPFAGASVEASFVV